ncbi:MAG: membrane protein insertase YidC [Synechococcus sp. SB0673_bin_10]|uniref:Membrane protein insertase YidC n=1 Tax=Synechococcus sp. SB0676_bin_10 TaxID=2604869 RepID=A0A6B1F7P9_9SYNE|nr:membrane protein insertase YidC [Synechococcus sp. SB0676_bin_10]MYG63059.1 membrane protein insertase YidC [Synechococcus sp. SB0675_bin_7]MYI72649.1 membrane protein insertase YidC [Synechococcus sp. SB0673_bin_10]MYK85277.1 membrane protein insertase YidC [Synechococcus sp. SB0669_bin_7]
MIGYISDNLLLPILDFFYGLVPNYGLAIVFLTVVIRLALFPLSAGSIRNARRMRIAQPVMKQRQEEIRARYANDTKRQQEELGKLMKEFGNPLAGCLPLLVQMPILFALFATLRGSPFADVAYTIPVKVMASDEIIQEEVKPFTSASHSIFLSETDHVPVVAALPEGNSLSIGDTATLQLETRDGESLAAVQAHTDHAAAITPSWQVTRGADVVRVDESGQITAVGLGSATVEGKVPGVASETGFLFIKALGHVGFYVDGRVNWDIAVLVAGFGGTLFVSQILSGWGMPKNPQQDATNRVLPFMMTGLFLFFPLPAGVLLYMVVANVLQALQTFLMTREALPANLQALLEQQLAAQAADAASGSALAVAADAVVSKEGFRGLLKEERTQQTSSPSQPPQKPAVKPAKPSRRKGQRQKKSRS